MARFPLEFGHAHEARDPFVEVAAPQLHPGQPPADNDVVGSQFQCIFKHLNRSVELLATLVVARQILELGERFVQFAQAEIDVGQFRVNGPVVGQ